MAPRLLPEELRTERLLLRQFRSEDAEALAEIYAQPEYLEYMPPLDLDGTRAQIERLTGMWEDDGHGQWAAEELESGRLGGIGRLERPVVMAEDAGRPGAGTTVSGTRPTAQRFGVVERSRRTASSL